jgi:2-octaprenyl-6-methoxyphenol hydroxylase
MTQEKTDIVIVGASYIGLSCAVAIKTALPHISLRIMEAAPNGAWENDTRSYAIARNGVCMFRQLDIWHAIEPEAQMINDMIVSDSQINDVMRPIFLTFEKSADAHEPFAYMVPNKTMIKALRTKAHELNIIINDGITATALKSEPSRIALTLSDNSIITAKLCIAADGVRSTLRAMMQIKTMKLDYGQSGIVVEVAHERAHNGRAVEHFLPNGPFAILPLKGNRSSLVWTEPTHNATLLINGDPLLFQIELERRFGHQLGELSVLNKPKSFPLGLTLAREFVKPRFALIGDAAHGIHPISGQGLNLGLRDSAAIAQTIVEAARLGLDIGQIHVLERYQQWRRFDTIKTALITDSLNRLFSNDNRALRLMRDVGLGLVDKIPPFKNFFMKQATGLEKSSPNLLRGEAI